MTKNMKKADAVAMFLQTCPDAKQMAKTDKPGLRFYWNSHTDMLIKNGTVSEKRAGTWSKPFLKKEDR